MGKSKDQRERERDWYPIWKESSMHMKPLGFDPVEAIGDPGRLLSKESAV